MHYFKNQRRSIRLFDYDYSQPGAYFVTILVKDKNCLIGKIIDNKMVLSDIGKIINQCWIAIPNLFPQIQLDEYAIMPNHLHGIIIINANSRGEVFSPESRGRIPLPDGRGAVSAPESTDNITQPENNKSEGPSPQRQQLYEFKGGETPPIPKRTLGQIIAYFKYQSTKKINALQFSPGKRLWQRNYYEHIIRNNELEHIRDYIIANPEMWQYDRENEQRLKGIQYRQKWGHLETKIYGKI